VDRFCEADIDDRLLANAANAKQRRRTTAQKNYSLGRHRDSEEGIEQELSPKYAGSAVLFRTLHLLQEIWEF
jgi:hypothetical protein